MLVALRVVAEVVNQLECQLGTSAGGNVNQRFAVEQVEFLGNLVEAGYLAQQAAFGIVQRRAFALLVPILAHQLVNLPILILLEGHILAANHNIAHLRDFHIVSRLGIVLHCRRHRGRRIARPHRREAGAVVLAPCNGRQQKQHQQRQYIFTFQCPFRFNAYINAISQQILHC